MDKFLKIGGTDGQVARGLKTNPQGVLQVEFEEQRKELTDMMWTWHTFPMSIFSETAQKTFIGGVRRGTPFGTSGHHIYSIDTGTGSIKGNQLSERFSGDDHNMVALADLPWDNKVMAFYAGHSNDGIYYKFVNNYDVTDLSEEYKIPGSEGSTYINVHHRLGGEHIYIISRISTEGYAVFYSNDLGTTWNKRALFTQNVYVDCGKNSRTNTEIGITVTGHGHTGIGDIWYGVLNIDGTIKKPDGTLLANVLTGENLPLSRDDFQLVGSYPESATTVTSVNSLNHRLTFIEAPDAENFDTFNYRYAIYNATTNEFDTYMVKEGAQGNLSKPTQPHYVGSCYDVGWDSPQIYLSHYNDAKEKWEIWEYSSRNAVPENGWSKFKMDESELKLFRPTGVMYDARSRKDIPGFWLKGYFTHYTEYFALAKYPFDMTI